MRVGLLAILGSAWARDVPVDNLAGTSTCHQSVMSTAYHNHIFPIKTEHYDHTLAVGQFYFRVASSDAVHATLRIGTGHDGAHTAVTDYLEQLTDAGVVTTTVAGVSGHFLVGDFDSALLTVPSDGELWVQIEVISGANARLDVGGNAVTDCERSSSLVAHHPLLLLPSSRSRALPPSVSVRLSRSRLPARRAQQPTGRTASSGAARARSTSSSS